MLEILEILEVMQILGILENWEYFLNHWKRSEYWK